MKTRIKSWILALGFVFVSGGAIVTVALPVTASAAPSCNSGFLGFPAWYRGLTTPYPDCSIETPTDSGGLSNFIWHIVLNCIDIALTLVGYISAIFIIYGGFMFLTSSGEAANIAKAKTTITNAVIGLIISIASVAIVNWIVGII